MAEQFREFEEKHSSEPHSGLLKLSSEANFWLQTASGALPAASERIQEELKTGEIWNSLGQGAAFGIGLSWMVNKCRPVPVRAIGTAIGALMSLKFTWDTGQVAGNILQLKDKAKLSGNYYSSVADAQRTAGRYIAESTVGLLGGHLGFLGEHGAHFAFKNWQNKQPILALDNLASGSIQGHKTTNNLPEHFNAMSSLEDNWKSNNHKAKSEAGFPVETDKTGDVNVPKQKPSEGSNHNEKGRQTVADLLKDLYRKGEAGHHDIPEILRTNHKMLQLPAKRVLGKGYESIAIELENMYTRPNLDNIVRANKKDMGSATFRANIDDFDLAQYQYGIDPVGKITVPGKIHWDPESGQRPIDAPMYAYEEVGLRNGGDSHWYIQPKVEPVVGHEYQVEIQNVERELNKHGLTAFDCVDESQGQLGRVPCKPGTPASIAGKVVVTDYGSVKSVNDPYVNDPGLENNYDF